MYLITGLGNPGEKYENTPHNAGFFFLDVFRETLKSGSLLSISQWHKDKLFESEYCKISEGDDLLTVLHKPTTFMNLSGTSVRKSFRKFKISDFANRFILVHDDLDLELGKYKIQKEKSPKSHNGVASVESHIGATNFLRIRIGVDGRESREIPGEKYVLTQYSVEDIEILRGAVLEAIRDLRAIVQY